MELYLIGRYWRRGGCWRLMFLACVGRKSAGSIYSPPLTFQKSKKEKERLRFKLLPFRNLIYPTSTALLRLISFLPFLTFSFSNSLVSGFWLSLSEEIYG